MFKFQKLFAKKKFKNSLFILNIYIYIYIYYICISSLDIRGKNRDKNNLKKNSLRMKRNSIIQDSSEIFLIFLG